jgi:hypothetical protein
MPFRSLSSALASGSQAWKTPFLCWCPWWVAAEVEFDRSSFFNKLAVWCWANICRFASVFRCSYLHGDGGGEERGANWWLLARRGSSAAAILGSASSTVLRQPAAVLPSTPMAEWRLLQVLACVADLRIFGRRQCIFNLLAGVPKGRPFCPRIAAFFGDLIPSGHVPGDEIAGRD